MRIILALVRLTLFFIYLFIYLFILYTLFQFGLTIGPIQNTALSNAKYNNALYGTIIT